MEPLAASNQSITPLGLVGQEPQKQEWWENDGIGGIAKTVPLPSDTEGDRLEFSAIPINEGWPIGPEDEHIPNNTTAKAGPILSKYR